MLISQIYIDFRRLIKWKAKRKTELDATLKTSDKMKQIGNN